MIVFGVHTDVRYANKGSGGGRLYQMTTAIDLDSGAHVERTRAGVLPPRDVAHLGGLNAGHSWRVWMTRRPIAGAVLAGLVAGQITTVFGIWFHGIGLPDLDWPIANGAVVDPKASIAVQFSIGEFIHGIDCIVFPLIFALFVFPLLGKVVTPAANLAKGIFFGLVLA